MQIQQKDCGASLWTTALTDEYESWDQGQSSPDRATVPVGLHVSWIAGKPGWVNYTYWYMHKPKWVWVGGALPQHQLTEAGTGEKFCQTTAEPPGE